MTRINVVPPEELHTKHLVAEYRELPRLFGLASRAAASGRELSIPRDYTLGKGHVLFFYPRLFWAAMRHRDLVNEMERRGFKPQLPSMYARWRVDLALIEKNWWQDWTPTQAALDLNRARLFDRAPKPTSGLRRMQRALSPSSPAPVQPAPETLAPAGGQKNGQSGHATFCTPLPFCAFHSMGNGPRSNSSDRASRPSNKEEPMKTFTKKSAAIKAAGAHLKLMATPETGVGFDVFSTGVETTAAETDGKESFTATIFVDGHSDEELAKIVAASPDFEIKVQAQAVETEKPAKAPEAEKPAKDPNAPAAPRATSLTGYTLQPAKFDAAGTAINPRKPGSFGANSMAVIIANPGIEVSEFVKAGGRMTDLRWDIEHGNVVATAPATAASPAPVEEPVAEGANV